MYHKEIQDIHHLKRVHCSVTLLGMIRQSPIKGVTDVLLKEVAMVIFKQNAKIRVTICHCNWSQQHIFLYSLWSFTRTREAVSNCWCCAIWSVI